jgi:hypothetical protein
LAVSLGQSVALADINAGRLVFTPAAHANGGGYASFTFQVQDDGGTANGVDLDPTPNTLTVNVTAVNDAPQGADNTVTTWKTPPTPLPLPTLVSATPTTARRTACWR